LTEATASGIKVPSPSKGITMRRAICISLILIYSIPANAWSQSVSGKIVKEGLKVFGKTLQSKKAHKVMVFGAKQTLKYFSRNNEAKQSSAEYNRSQRENIEDLDKQFRSQGLPESKTAIYSLFLNLDYNKRALYWADYLSGPDVFFVIEIEGIGKFITPQITREYKGGPIQCTLVLPVMKPNTRVIVRVMDDDTSSKDVWDSILLQKVAFRFTIDRESITPLGLLKIGTEANGTFQFLDGSKNILVNAPNQIATVEFQIPENNKSKWLADDELFDSSSQRVGNIQLSQIWNRQAELDSLKPEIKQKR
jgi:hypothetical protein